MALPRFYVRWQHVFHRILSIFLRLYLVSTHSFSLPLAPKEGFYNVGDP
jgi:hypothetical protein